MTFYGQEEASKAPEEAKPLRTYEFFKYRNAGSPQSVEAHYIQFQPDHVTFWQTRGDKTVQDTLVLSIINSDVLNLKEVTS